MHILSRGAIASLLLGRWLIAAPASAQDAFQPPAQLDSPQVLAEAADAYVAISADERTWAIGNANITLTLGLDDSGSLVLRSLTSPDVGRSLDLAATSDATIQIDDNLTNVGASAGGFVFAGAEGEQLP